jgi:heptaprenyl diphosphate synthase
MTALNSAQIHSLAPVMQAVEARLQEISSEHAGTLGAHAWHVIRAGGKRLRPLLVILCSSIDDPSCQPLIDMAAAAELIHTASLIHDDIIDRSDSRRSVPTLNHLHGNHTAVLAGDFLFALAFGLLTRSRCPEALALMADAVQAMCQAEIEQKESLFQFSLTESMYLRRIEKKTAALLAACCGAGALAGGLEPEAVASLASYGRNLGLCFQITDDLLDFTGDSADLGKPAGSDLAQGILTLPVIYLLQNELFEFGNDMAPGGGMAPGGVPTALPDRSRIREIARRGSRSEDDLDYIRRAVCATPALELARLRALHFAREAGRSLEQGKRLFQEKTGAALLGLVEQVLQRQR